MIRAPAQKNYEIPINVAFFIDLNAIFLNGILHKVASIINPRVKIVLAAIVFSYGV